MDLPNEILLKVAPYLRLKDRAVSALVCKSWSEIFISQLYEKLDLRLKTKRDQDETSHQDKCTSEGESNGDGDAPREPKPLWIALLQKYGHYIRDLSLCIPGPYIRELPPSINALLRLHVESPPKEENVAYDSLDRRGLKRLLVINPQIQHIFFEGLQYQDAFKLFFQVAESCLQLQSLEVLDSYFRSKDILSVLERNPKLKRLAFSNNDRYYRFCTPPPHAWQDSFPRLGALMFGQSNSTLKTLKPDQLKTLLFSIPITQLRIIDYNMDEDELTAALDSWPEVKHLVLECEGFGSRSMSALGRHFGHLHTLDLANSQEFMTWMCEIVFAACPLLVDLGMCFVNMDSLLEEERREGKEPSVVTVMKVLQINVDHVSPYNWACVRLQRFRVACLVLPETHERRKRAADQLLALKHLKHLQFEEVIGTRDSSASLSEGDPKIYWKQGDFGRRQLEQDTETQWMIKAWPNLQTFRMLTSSFSTVVSCNVDD